MEELKEMQKNLQIDRDVIKQEKAILEEKVNKQTDELISVKD